MSITYAYVNGTSGGGDSRIDFNGSNGAPSFYVIGGSGNYKTIGFTYTSSIISTVTFNLEANQGGITIFWIVSENAPSSTQNFDAATWYSSTSGLNTTNLGTIYNSGGTWETTPANNTGTFTDVPANTYITFIFSKNGNGSGNLTTTTTACFGSDS